ncbi:MAG: bifunctional (p)ppGpp synthetase/guanosine-3',5'-bis(diphosphate) 3'-pyrophosphohydrolase [Sneathiellaceae bacterium]
MLRQVELVEKVCAYDADADEDVLNRAYVFTMRAHGTQMRASGDPYFSHPIEVAGILADMRLDGATIVTALLHDTLEDTAATPAEIERLFGPDILQLVDGVTKLSRIEMQSDRSRQAENFRKLLLAMSADIRVLLVKLADRLHNMRTLGFIGSEEKRRRIARETMEIYAPLADRIGMQEMKAELEDLAFTHMNPEGRESIIARLTYLRAEGSDMVRHVSDTLQETLDAAGIACTVTGREKSPFSIWRKMQRKNIAFEQLSDVMAFRVLVENVADCYHALGVVHSTWRMVPGRFKDFVSTPKPNQYQSIHTTVIGPDSHRIEIQIRSRSMHEVAEIGVAAHWYYKTPSDKTEKSSYRWLRELLDILENASDPEEFLENTKLNMFQDQVFCFTPKGDLIALPRGATPIDFAYAVHSDIGNHTVGAKINGRILPLRTELQNGDQIEIITSPKAQPTPNWESILVTGKARANVRRFVRQQQRSEYVSLGKAILQKAFREAGRRYSEKSLSANLERFQCATVEDLLVAVGNGTIAAGSVIGALFPAARDRRPPESAEVIPLELARRQQSRPMARDQAVPLQGLIPGMAVHYAGCCHPLPGDRIVGIVTTGKGVTVHTLDCDTLEQFSQTPERWLHVGWADAGNDGDHVGRLATVVRNDVGSLSALTTVIARQGGNITNLKIVNRTQDLFELLVDIEVRDVTHLGDIIASLRTDPAISAVERARG